MKLNTFDKAHWTGQMVVVKKKGADPKFVGAASAVSIFASRIPEPDCYGKDEAGRIVVYRDGVWSHDEEWLKSVVLYALHDEWSTYLEKQVLGAIQRRADEVPYVVGDWINFKNMLVNWRTLETADHCPKLTGTLQMGTDIAMESHAPAWQAFLDRAVPADAHDFVQELAGYLLMWGNPYQVAVMVHGPGGSGKSTFLNVMRSMIGSDNCSAVSLKDLDGNRFAKANIYGKTANICGDIGAGKLPETETFKQITGGDEIPAEFKGQQGFKFVSPAILMFSANSVPKSADTTSAFLRRWLFLPFTAQVAAQDREIGYEDALMDELPQIAWWALQGLRRLMERGHFDPPASVEDAKEAYRIENDPVYEWAGEHFHGVADSHATGKKALPYYESFTAWYIATFNRVCPIANHEFYRRMEEFYGLTRKKHQGTGVYWAMTLKTPVETY